MFSMLRKLSVTCQACVRRVSQCTWSPCTHYVEMVTGKEWLFKSLPHACVRYAATCSNSCRKYVSQERQSVLFAHPADTIDRCHALNWPQRAGHLGVCKPTWLAGLRRSKQARDAQR
jgi:hypothetical protein